MRQSVKAMLAGKRGLRNHGAMAPYPALGKMRPSTAVDKAKRMPFVRIDPALAASVAAAEAARATAEGSGLGEYISRPKVEPITCHHCQRSKGGCLCWHAPRKRPAYLILGPLVASTAVDRVERTLSTVAQYVPKVAGKRNIPAALGPPRSSSGTRAVSEAISAAMLPPVVARVIVPRVVTLHCLSCDALIRPNRDDYYNTSRGIECARCANA